jgi:hypothetical protein
MILMASFASTEKYVRNKIMHLNIQTAVKYILINHISYNAFMSNFR